MLNRGVHPRARRIGTLGEADLAPLAQLFLPLTGHGEAELDGAVLPGPEAHAARRHRPARRSAAKDGSPCSMPMPSASAPPPCGIDEAALASRR